MGDLLDSVPAYAPRKLLIRGQLENVTRTCPSLVPRPGTLFDMQTGQDNKLVVLGGTVPISYSGAAYNIPVEIFLVETFPTAPPLIYVRPTADMIIKPNHGNVHPDGLLFVPYLHSWNLQTHNLVGLVQEMRAVFTREPPCFAKPVGQPAYQQQQQPNYAQQARQLPPPQYGGVAGQGQQPPPPSYAAAQSHTTPTAAPSGSSSTAFGGGGAGAGAAAPAAQGQLVAQLNGKIQSKLRERCEITRDDIDIMVAREKGLERDLANVRTGVAQLRKQKEQLSARLVHVQGKTAEVQSWLDVNSGEAKEPEVDELLLPNDVRSEQLLQLLAESAAIDDLLYQLGQAVKAGKVGLDEFLKMVRVQSRRKFICNAMIDQIQNEQQRRIGSSARAL